MDEKGLHDNILKGLLQKKAVMQPCMTFSAEVMTKIHKFEHKQLASRSLSITQVLLIALCIIVFVGFYAVLFSYLSFNFPVSSVEIYFSYVANAIEELLFEAIRLVSASVILTGRSTTTLIFLLVVALLFLVDQPHRRILDATTWGSKPGSTIRD